MSLALMCVERGDWIVQKNIRKTHLIWQNIEGASEAGGYKLNSELSEASISRLFR